MGILPSQAASGTRTFLESEAQLLPDIPMACPLSHSAWEQIVQALYFIARKAGPEVKELPTAPSRKEVALLLTPLSFTAPSHLPVTAPTEAAQDRRRIGGFLETQILGSSKCLSLQLQEGPCSLAPFGTCTCVVFTHTDCTHTHIQHTHIHTNFKREERGWRSSSGLRVPLLFQRTCFPASVPSTHRKAHHHL